jgi:hypothetical protein
MATRELPDPELLRKLLSYDPLSGILTWKDRPREMFSSARIWKSWNAVYANTEAMTAINNGYRMGQIQNRQYRAHRIIWMMVYGTPPEGQIDHINGDRSDNRLVNLRCVSVAENRRNQKTPITNTSGFIGVGWHKHTGKWRASIKINGRAIHLGGFDTIEQAVQAREAAQIELGFHPNHGRAA